MTKSRLKSSSNFMQTFLRVSEIGNCCTKCRVKTPGSYHGLQMALKPVILLDPCQAL